METCGGNRLVGGGGRVNIPTDGRGGGGGDATGLIECSDN